MTAEKRALLTSGLKSSVRRNRARAVIGALALTLVSACTPPAPTLPPAPRNAVQMMAGEWSGSYTGPDSRQAGAINFSLPVGDTIARGSIVRVPVQHPAKTSSVAGERGEVPILIQITFVQIADGQVTGVLEPHVHPACDCAVETTFTGRMTAQDRFEGTFLTRAVGTNEQLAGKWEVRRKAGH